VPDEEIQAAIGDYHKKYGRDPANPQELGDFMTDEW
jgi:hypothetical protein